MQTPVPPPSLSRHVGAPPAPRCEEHVKTLQSCGRRLREAAGSPSVNALNPSCSSFSSAFLIKKLRSQKEEHLVPTSGAGSCRPTGPHDSSDLELENHRANQRTSSGDGENKGGECDDHLWINQPIDQFIDWSIKRVKTVKGFMMIIHQTTNKRRRISRGATDCGNVPTCISSRLKTTSWSEARGSRIPDGPAAGRS
ncbi:Hypothetical protein SMAX5B_004710 [Scophthalmus maximus]|uniref:Uncharacterized protein n=1 Tax=Scophthalmus maximus TaxID=52904 RepID=A0A2U9BVM6_SCOMX|nr:Hypothetical protein SMAX5B_004710 [Scophthalmus maximus]